MAVTGVRIPGGSDTFLNAIGVLFSIAVGFRSGKVRGGLGKVRLG